MYRKLDQLCTCIAVFAAVVVAFGLAGLWNGVVLVAFVELVVVAAWLAGLLSGDAWWHLRLLLADARRMLKR